MVSQLVNVTNLQGKHRPYDFAQIGCFACHRGALDSNVDTSFPAGEKGPDNAPFRYDFIIWRYSSVHLNLIIVPTATTQVVLTQVLAPQGRGVEELNALSA